MHSYEFIHGAKIAVAKSLKKTPATRVRTMTYAYQKNN